VLRGLQDNPKNYDIEAKNMDTFDYLVEIIIKEFKFKEEADK